MFNARPRTPFRLATAALAIPAVVAAAAVGCSLGADAGRGSGTANSDRGNPSPSAATPAERGVGDLGVAAGETSGGGGTPGPAGTTASSGGTKTAPPAGPRVVTFRIKQKPQCPAGTNVAPVPGVPLVIEWVVERADQVDLSVDGPGRYDTYPPTGSETFTFGCGGAPGTVEKHTYTITTVGAGTPASKTLTASATVNEIPNV